MSFILRTICCCFVLVASLGYGAEIRTSVSPEFPNGLHSRYLKYLADKMDMEIDVQPMPIARRIKELENGKLDILVGLIKRRNGNKHFIYLSPGYERLTSSFFVLKEKASQLGSSEDLNKLVIGVTNGSEYFSEFEHRSDVVRVEVSSLEQKIGLLLKGRVDSFLHYRQSTLAKLAKSNLLDKVVLADYQPKVHESHHFVITKASQLFKKKEELEQIIEQGVQNGDFQRMRENYYSKKRKQ